MAKNRITHVPKPTYPGGLAAMRKFITENLKYPPEAITAKVGGTVTLRYSLDYRGKVVEVKVKKGIGFGCDEEAKRVVRLLRFNVPQNRKKKVRIHQDININFNLPNAQPTIKMSSPEQVIPTLNPTSLTINYVSSGNKSSTSNTPAPNKKGYRYTIKW